MWPMEDQDPDNDNVEDDQPTEEDVLARIQAFGWFPCHFLYRGFDRIARTFRYSKKTKNVAKQKNIKTQTKAQW